VYLCYPGAMQIADIPAESDSDEAAAPVPDPALRPATTAAVTSESDSILRLAPD
jgi:hypothetical protein